MSENEKPWVVIKLFRHGGKIRARVEHSNGAVETVPDYLGGCMARLKELIVTHVKW